MPSYLRYSKSAYYGVAVAALPLLIIYELLLMTAGQTAAGQVRNAGDVWLRMILASLDVAPSHATLVMILILILTIPMVRRRELPIRFPYVALLLLESIGYSLVFGAAIQFILVFLRLTLFSGVGPGLLAGSPLPWNRNTLQALALSVGAGLFEEFLFRVVLLTVLLTFARAIFAPWLAATLAIVAAAFLFSLAHYVGPYGDVLSVGSFLFRFIAGLLFTALYYSRGFAVTAYTHAFYDIRVILF